MFIPDLDLDFLPIPDLGYRGQKATGSRIQGSKSLRIPDPGIKKASDPGSGFATLFLGDLYLACMMMASNSVVDP
jgi:hypothetical protein